MYTLILISALFLETFCFAELTQRDLGAIIGGHPAKRYPFFVRVQASPRGSNRGKMCGGTIVNKYAVVSASHCIYNRDSERWFKPSETTIVLADFTKPNWKREATEYPVFGGSYHAEYDPNNVQNFENDICVLITAFNFDPNYNSILEPCPADANYKQAVAIGLGLVQQNPKKRPDVLQEVRLNRDPGCRSWGDEIDPDKQVCYSVPGKADTCSGDSGGPLVHMKGGRVKCLLGITSFGKKGRCDNPDFAGVYTRAGYYADWIEDQLLQLIPTLIQ